MSEFFSALGKFRGTFGSTLNGQVQSDIFYATRAEVQQRARGGARRSERSDVGLHAARRRREPPSADLPPVPEAPAADDEASGSALLRLVRAARLLGRPHLLDRRGAEDRAGVARAAGPRVRGSLTPRVHRALDRLAPDRRQARRRLFERRRVRRSPVHAPQLQRRSTPT